MSRDAMKLALEALVAMSPSGPTGSLIWHQQMYAITALREVLAAQPAQQEPVAWMVDVDLANYQGQSEYRTILAWNAKPVWSGTHEINEVLKAVPLYTSPSAQRTWVRLTDGEISKMPAWIYSPDQDGMTAEEGLEVFARAIEAKLKEKNT